MTTSEEKFGELMARVLAGSEEAAQELFLFYEPILLRAIRRNLHQKLRSKFDSGDFTQDVWASFFRESPKKRVFANREALVAFLTELAKTKVAGAVRLRMMGTKFNANREGSLDGSMQFVRDDLVASDPSPSLAISLEEEWKAFLRKQPLVYQRIFILIRQGRTHEQIAQEMGINERTVRRAVLRLEPGGTS